MNEKQLAHQEALQKFDRILKSHPIDAKNRILAALQDFGIVRRSTATQRLRVKEQVDGNFRIIRGFKHLCQELIDEGFPVAVCRRPRKNGNGDELCLSKLMKNQFYV